MAIENFYRVSVHFEAPDDYDDSVLDEYCYSDSTANWNEFSGNGVCGPYVEFECESLVLAQSFESAVIAKLQQHNCQIVV